MTRFAGDTIDLTDYMGDFDASEITSAAADARSSKKVMDIQGTSMLNRYGLDAMAQGIAADNSAAATRKTAANDASAKVWGAITDGLTGMAGAGIKAYGRANNLGIYGD